MLYRHLLYINKIVERLVFWLTAISTFLFILFVVLGVITRYLTRTPLFASIELSRLFFVWACFFAATLCYRRNAHIAISFLVDMLPWRLERAVSLLVQFITILFFIVILKESLLVVQLLWNTNLPLTGISQSWLYIPLPVVSVLFLLFSAEQLAGIWLCRPNQ
jgi:TRAP-type C4-dicarboxylate transport system permease small subunit